MIMHLYWLLKTQFDFMRIILCKSSMMSCKGHDFKAWPGDEGVAGPFSMRFP